MDLNEKSNLTFEEAEDLCLKSKWKLSFCGDGEKCWCRLIVPETEIYDKDGNEIYVVGMGALPTIYAEHIVNLHNKSL